MTDAKAKGLSTKGDALLVDHRDGKDQKIAADKILVTVGRKPVTEGWGLEEIDLDRAGRFIKIDDQCRTSMRGIYAIGDVTGEPMLAHRAMAQGEMVAEIVAGHKRSWDKRCIPAICFTDPEIVSSGLTPDEAKAVDQTSRPASSPSPPMAAPCRSSARTASSASPPAPTTTLCSASRRSARACGFSAAFALAIEMGARLEDIAATIHAHPTQGEGFQEAHSRRWATRCTSERRAVPSPLRGGCRA